MMDAKIKRTMKWHTDGSYIDTDMYDYKYLIDYEYEGNIVDNPLWPKTNSAISNLKTSKEEKKMHKKDKVNGHVIHRLPKCPGLYYTVEPEHSCIAVYILMYDQATGETYYSEFEDIAIRTKNLGRHGYLEEQIEWIARRHSDLTSIHSHLLEREKMLNDDTFAGCLSNIKEDLRVLNDTVFKEEKKMNNKVKYLFKITVDGKTQQTISIFDDGVDPAWFYFEYDSSFKKDAIDSLLHYIGSMEIGVPHIHIIYSSPCFSYHKIRYVTKDVTKVILTELMKLGVFGDVTKHTIRIEDPDPEGFTGTVYLTAVYIRGGEGCESINNHQFTSLESVGRCVVQIKDGKYLKGVTGKPEMIGMFKHHSSIFESEDDIRLFVKNKWEAKAFGPKANYYNLCMISE